MNNELKAIWKEAVLDEFKALSWHLPGGTQEDHRNLRTAKPSAVILCSCIYWC
jgi:hypothetical protein